VPEARVCVVSFTDCEGITHSVEVAASSLFEAAVRGLAAFGRHELTPGAAVGPGTRLTVAVKNPAVQHIVAVDRVRAWLASNGRTPREHAFKVQLRGEVGYMGSE
jgi:hypothetical protein